VTESERKKALGRVKKLAGEAHHLTVYGKALDLTRLTNLVAELADEVAKILATPQQNQQRRRAR